MANLCDRDSGAKGWWRSILMVAAVWLIPSAVMLIVAFAGPFLASQVLAVCALWSAPFALHIIVLALERSFWHYCERANSSEEHAKEQFRALLANFETDLGMCVKIRLRMLLFLLVLTL